MSEYKNFIISKWVQLVSAYKLANKKKKKNIENFYFFKNSAHPNDMFMI